MSKLLLFDFSCTKCGLVFEELAKPANYWSKCPDCEANARREISPVRIDHSRMAISESASPGSIDYFDRVHQQRKVIEEKSMQNHGDYGKAAGSD
jgi:putative FmdB family regulatory protein